MGKVTFDLNGKKQLLSTFDKMSRDFKDEIKKAVKRRAYGMERRMKKEAPYDTGHLKRNIKTQFYNKGLSAETTSHAKYSIYLELGTRNMPAQPFFFGNYIKTRKMFTNDIEKIIKELEL